MAEGVPRSGSARSNEYNSAPIERPDEPPWRPHVARPTLGLTPTERDNMRIRQALLIVSLVGAVGTLSVEGPASATTSATSSVVSAHEQAVRQFWGLNSDPSFVARVDADPAALKTYGVAMTAAEVSDLRSRLPIQDAASTVLENLTPPQRSDLGSAWYDQAHGGIFHISFIRDAAKYAPDLIAKFAVRGKIAVDSAAISDAELAQAVGKVTEAIQTKPNMGIVSVGQNGERGSVEVSALAASMSAVRDAITGMHLGVPVNYTTVDRISTTNVNAFTAPPTIAGLAIWRNSTTSGVVTLCSSGYFAKDGLGNRYLFTAGHCAVNGDNTSYRWSVGHISQPVHPLSAITSRRFTSNYPDDASLIPLLASDGTAEVYSDTNQQAATSDYVSAVGSFGDGYDIVNAQVCNIGRGLEDDGTETAYTYCGPVLGNNYTDTYPAGDGFPQTTLIHTRHSGALNRGGYSGGPVYGPTGQYVSCGALNAFACYRDRAEGLISGEIVSNGVVTTIYTHIRYAMSDFGVNVVTM